MSFGGQIIQGVPPTINCTADEVEIGVQIPVWRSEGGVLVTKGFHFVRSYPSPRENQSHYWDPCRSGGWWLKAFLIQSPPFGAAVIVLHYHQVDLEKDQPLCHE
uniref:Uncharacterized protein n=1 Tax=Timema douglasi TaxID=61478 RepID=A0A7R8Z8N4_TIMDO|nr:unnamed protein product [Timema douglasi]